MSASAIGYLTPVRTFANGQWHRGRIIGRCLGKRSHLLRVRLTDGRIIDRTERGLQIIYER